MHEKRLFREKERTVFISVVEGTENTAPKGDSLSAFRFFQASCAYVAFLLFTVLHKGNLLHVYLEGPSRSALGVADIVAGRLAFTANTANFGHYFHTSEVNFSHERKRSA